MALGITKQGRLNNTLIEAVENNDLDAVKKAIEDGAEPHCEDQRVFKLAVMQNSVDIAEHLINLGANPNVRFNTNAQRLQPTPLYHAASHNHVEMVRLLAGNEKTLLNNSGYIVTSNGNQTVYKDNTTTPLALAEQKQFIEVCFLIAKEEATRLQAKTDLAHAKSSTYEKLIISQREAREQMNKVVPKSGITKLGR